MENKTFNIRPEFQEKFKQLIEILPDTRDEKVYLTLKAKDLAALGAETVAALLLPSKGALVKFSEPAKNRIMEGISYFGEPPEAAFIRQNLKTKNPNIKQLLKEIEEVSPDIWQDTLFLVCLYQCKERADLDSFEEFSEAIEEPIEENFD